MSSLPRLLPLVAALACAPAQAGGPDDLLFQYSTINALLKGLYDGELSLGELARHGDFGIGTLNSLDGELLGLDGRFYQVRTDGRAYEMGGDTRTPFATVARFEADAESPLPAGLDYPALQQHLEGLVPGANHFQAIRIEGRFPALKVRSVPAQTPPYLPLASVVEHQAVFELADVTGTLVGFRTPGYVAGVNVPGYHFHFIDSARERGGHVLGLTTAEGTIQVDRLSGVTVRLPDDAAFDALDLTGGRADLERVEKGPR